MKVSDFWMLSEDEQAIMIATVQAEGMMETWESQQAEKKVDSDLRDLDRKN